MVGVRLAPVLALGILPQLVRQQRADGPLVEVDDAVFAGCRLRLAERHAKVSGLAVGARSRGLLVLLTARLLHDLLPYNDDSLDEINVVPAQPNGLAPAHPGTGYDFEQAAEAVCADAVEELAELGWLPRLHLGPLRLGQLDVLGSVEGEHALADCR
ncbi:hypothetical protein [Streptomyces smyrnaeus]|uniref:hypothetical protein n=1 Tax=Streptomyces smyrnaeus TaxID=1387713 RepID=UPI003F4CEC6F